jgi:hypothetical protein
MGRHWLDSDMSNFLLHRTLQTTARRTGIFISLTLAMGCTQTPYTAPTFPLLKSYETQVEPAFPKML